MFTIGFSPRARPEPPAKVAATGAAQHESQWRLRGCAWIFGTLHFLGASGCALEARAGDGLVTDGLQVSVSPTVVYPMDEVDAAMPDGVCIATETFKLKVSPHFVKRCVECHDGTSSKARAQLDLSKLTTSPDVACIISLFFGAKQAANAEAEIITSSDPGRPDKDHEFKYKDLAEFNAFRADVLTWLNAERPPSGP